jgi:predicted NBD/HSP70 family sugar kinase
LKAIRKLGAAMAGLLHVFDPEIVIIGGQVADAGVADKSGIVGAAGLVMALAWVGGTRTRLTATPASFFCPNEFPPPYRRTSHSEILKLRDQVQSVLE